LRQFTATCSFCTHKCLRDAYDSMFPKEDTPPKDISIGMGDYRFSLLCTNPDCHKYTITCTNREDMEYLIKKYKKSTVEQVPNNQNGGLK
jgi:hypothetical protein